MRAQAERLASDLALLCESAKGHAQGAEHVTGMFRLQADAITKLAAYASVIGEFALQTLDQGRSKARLWKERSIVPEAAATRRPAAGDRSTAGFTDGAPIADILQQDKF